MYRVFTKNILPIPFLLLYLGVIEIKEKEMKKKHNTKDIGYGTKVTALSDMNVHNKDFDLLADEFNNDFSNDDTEWEWSIQAIAFILIDI